MININYERSKEISSTNHKFECTLFFVNDMYV